MLTVGGELVANVLLGHNFLSDVQLQSLLDDSDRVPLRAKPSIFNENPRIVGGPQISWTRRTLYGIYGAANQHKQNPHKLHDLPVLERVAERVLQTAKKIVVGLTTKYSKAWGDAGWSPNQVDPLVLGTFNFFCRAMENIFQMSPIRTGRHGPYKRRLKNCFKGWSLVKPSMSLCHMHHCMSMNALEKGLLVLEAAKASDIDDFV